MPEFESKVERELAGSFTLAMLAEGIEIEMVNRILLTVQDAVDNNDSDECTHGTWTMTERGYIRYWAAETDEKGELWASHKGWTEDGDEVYHLECDHCGFKTTVDSDTVIHWD
jgi:hypothetical protein